MATARLDILKNMVAQNPADSFSHYGLAMEYRASGDAEAAVAEFRTLIEKDPSYIAAYFHCGQALEALNRTDEASAVYRAGIEISARRGDRHTLRELEAALELLA